jgi:hypothetical protein
MAISKMKMHELEAAIDSVKKLRSGAEEALATKTPSKTGRPSSRPIPVEDQEDEDVIIHVPSAPAERKTKKESTKESTKEPGPKGPARGTKAMENDYGVDLFPGVMRRAKEAEAKRVPVHKCNCSDCPKK